MVLLAEDPLLKRSVALKVMRPELAARPDAGRRFLREAQATAAIEHPNIVHVYQVGEDRGVPFLAMPFLKGEALDARLKREKRLPVAEAVYLGRQIAEGLAAAHRNGLIHRDIKPANIWLERQEGEAAPRAWVKILDFGLARAVADDDGHLTKTGAILGTPAFMAPEQARGGKVDHRCDLFSLGAVLYRMLTGEAPFKGSDPISLIAALALDTPRPVRELNPETPAPLADLVMRLLAKDPDGRPPTARAVADALAAMEQDQTQVLETGARATPAAKPGRKGRRWLLSVVGGGGLLGLLALVLVFILHPGSRPADPGPPPQPPEPEKVITNSIGMKLVRIEPGKFVMGSPPDEVGRRDDEDAHEVAITKPFYLGACKVTVGQFKAFVKETKYQTDAEKTGEGAYVSGPKGALTLDPKVTWRTPPFVQNDDEPVVCVTWDDALAFCVWLGKKEGKPYSLPTEAQWEYACRAGSQTRSPFGEDGDATQYVSFDANSQGKTHAVGQKKPNAWGLYDMEGITFELTADWYDKDYYKISPTQDPPGPGAARPCRAARRRVGGRRVRGARPWIIQSRGELPRSESNPQRRPEPQHEPRLPRGPCAGTDDDEQRRHEAGVDTGGHVRHGFTARRTGPQARRRAAARGGHQPADLCGNLPRDRGGVPRLRQGDRLQDGCGKGRQGRPGLCRRDLEARPGDQLAKPGEPGVETHRRPARGVRDLERRRRLLLVAEQQGGPELPAADRGRMGIRLPGGDADRLLLRRRRQVRGGLCLGSRKFRRARPCGGRQKAQRLGPVRHARQCL